MKRSRFNEEQIIGAIKRQEISRAAKRYIARDKDSGIRDMMKSILIENPRYECAEFI